MGGDEFEWDARKAQSNLAKHGVGFEDARLVFDDAFALDRLDAGGGHAEPRYVITGMTNGVLLTVVYAERGERTRIISARRATRHERREYFCSQASG
jgi:uncharacterized DUF497 family protein